MMPSQKQNGCFNWMIPNLYMNKWVVSPFPSIQQLGTLEFHGSTYLQLIPSLWPSMALAKSSNASMVDHPPSRSGGNIADCAA